MMLESAGEFTIETTMIAFEPVTESQKLLHAEALRAHMRMIESRRLRLAAVKSGLPGVMWAVMVVGALIGLGSSFLFKVEEERVYGILVTLLATFMGLVIFMIFALGPPVPRRSWLATRALSTNLRPIDEAARAASFSRTLDRRPAS